MTTLKKKLLTLLEADARYTPEQLATMLAVDVKDVKKAVDELQNEGILVGYKALIDWDKTDKESVTAFIEIRVTPQADRGFDKVAERIYSYPEVQDMYLMSGAYDFLLLIEGRTLKEVALFVAEKLSPIDGVISTATHFVLRKYKDKGIVFGAEPEKDEREGIL